MCNNNNEYNVILYNSVWNNIYLKNVILNHTHLFNMLSINIKFKSIEDWEEFKYKEYLNCVTFSFDYDFNLLPPNITKLYISKTPSDKNRVQVVPDHIDSIKIIGQLHKESTFNNLYLKSEYLNSISSKLDSLSVSLINGQEIELNSIPQSVKNLDIGYFDELKKNVLPNDLRKLSIQSVDKFESGCFPKSITDIQYLKSNPSIINELSSNNLVNLKFSSDSHAIDSSVIFPSSLQNLSITTYSTFNATLPCNLKKLNIYIRNYKYKIAFPSSLEHLSIEFEQNELNQNVFQNRQELPNNLKLLQIQCSSIVDNNGQSLFPDKLETLYFNSQTEGYKFNQILQVNQLPSSLTKLDLGSSFNQIIDINVLPTSLTYLSLGDSFNQVIDVNILPSNLKKLIFGDGYRQIINPLAIPLGLELLEIRNFDYEHPINLTTTHTNTEILCSNLNLYYDVSDTSIRTLRLPGDFSSPLSVLQLQDKSSLEYLHLGGIFEEPIKLSDLPVNNNIKTLVLSNEYNETINLDYFPNVETIIINYSYSKQIPNITTSKTIDEYGNLVYNNYKLKNIEIQLFRNSKFIKQLDANFYKFLKYKP